MGDYSHGADALAQGIATLGGGIGRRLAYDDQLRERDAKAQTLADLINAAQSQMTGYDDGGAEGPMSGNPQFESSYPAPEDLPPGLQKGAARYDLLDFYLKLRESAQPQYKVEGDSILKFPAGGKTPSVVGQLPVKQKATTPKEQAFADTYRTFISSGMTPDKAFERAMKASEAGNLEVEGVKQGGAGKRAEAANASRERIAEMGDKTKRFIGQLQHDSRVRAAEINSGSKSKSKLSMVIPSYPGKIGGALMQMRYEANPNDSTSMETVYNKINTRIRSLDEMARKSGISKGEKFAGISIPGMGTSAGEAKTLWNRFVSQFANEGIFSVDNPSVDDMRRILNAQNSADGGDGTLYDDADEQMLQEDFTLAQDAALGYDELPGDMSLMGQEYINDVVFKRHLEDTYGLAPAIEQGGGGETDGGGGASIEQMRQQLREYAKTKGGNPANVDAASDADIKQAYEMMQKETQGQ